MKRRNDGIDVQGKRPCFEFYPADWIRDLAPCSPVAKGVWVDLICHMHFAQQRGYLETPAGAPFSEAQLSRMTGTTVRELKAALAELEACSIFSRDDNGTIFNRRMVRDTDISRKRAEAAAKRLQDAERTDAGTFAPAKEPAKAEQTGEQKTVLSPSSSSSSSSSPSGATAALAGADLLAWPESVRVMQELQPTTDGPIARKIITLAVQTDPDITDAELSLGLGLTHKRTQTSAALWLHTLPPWAKNTGEQRRALRIANGAAERERKAEALELARKIRDDPAAEPHEREWAEGVLKGAA